MLIDIRAMELLSSKICHDLVSPISAINNGVELIEDIGGSVVDEAMKLIGNSAVHAARRLRLFRLAYGRAGSEDNLSLKEVRQVAEQYLSTGKTMMNWPEDQPTEFLANHKGFLKVLLNVIIMSEEVLAYGGVVTLRPAAKNEIPGCRLEIVGRGAQLAPAYKAALDGSVNIAELTPRSIQSYITGRLAEHFGFGIENDHPDADRLDLTLFGRVHTSMAT